jgi:hypothetical protein
MNYDKEKADAITKTGINAIREYVEALKEYGLEVEDLLVPTHYENIGGTVFPVQYHPNGVIIIDYPDNLNLFPHIKGEKTFRGCKLKQI